MIFNSGFCAGVDSFNTYAAGISNNGSKKTSRKGKEKEAQPKKRRGRPKKVVNLEERVFEDEVLEHLRNFVNNVGEVGQSSRENHFSEDEEQNSDELDSGVDSDEEGAEKPKYPLFKQHDSMVDYKWEVGTYFASKIEFQDAVRTYSVHDGKGLKFKKSDKKRVRVRCKPGCNWEMYCAKIPDQETWQLRKIIGKHSCSNEYNPSLMNSKWLGRKLHTRVKEDPRLGIPDIINRTHRKWNVGVCPSKAYRARSYAKELVDGSFREQYTRMYDYCHELLRSNEGSTVRVTTIPFQGAEGDLENRNAVFCPHFQRVYVCFKACKESFMK